MQVKHQNNKQEGRFWLEDGGAEMGEMTYRWRTENVFVINHTQVDESLEGKGAGKQLVDAAAEYAREQNIKIVPVCSYAKHVMEKGDTYADVLA